MGFLQDINWDKVTEIVQMLIPLCAGSATPPQIRQIARDDPMRTKRMFLRALREAEPSLRFRELHAAANHQLALLRDTPDAEIEDFAKLALEMHETE